MSYIHTYIYIYICVCYGRFPKSHRVFLGRDPGTLKSDIVSKTSTINLFGFETLKMKIRRLKLWKPTVLGLRRQALANDTDNNDNSKHNNNNTNQIHNNTITTITTPGLRYKIPVFSDPAPGKS